MHNDYQFAGVSLTLEMPDDLKDKNWEPLPVFRTEQVEDPHVFQVVHTESLSAPEGDCVWNHPKLLVYRQGEKELRYVGDLEKGWQNAHVQVESRGRQHTVRIPKTRSAYGIGKKHVLSALCAEHLVLETGGCILHASYIAWKDKAILFTAPSGTGKSTQAALWQTLRDAEVINGDRAVIRMDAGVPVACGLPYAGSSGICKNRTLPLAAIVYLSQAPETELHTLTGYRAFRRIWEGCSLNVWNRQDLLTGTEIVDEIIRKVPVFHLACTPDESAVTILEQELGKRDRI